MNKRRITSMILVVVILITTFNFSEFSFNGPDISNALDYRTIVNNEGTMQIKISSDIPDTKTFYGSTYSLNKELLFDSGITSVSGLEYGIIVYSPGSLNSISGNEYKSGEWRYLGYDMVGNKFSNPDFPNDADSGRYPSQKDWVDVYERELELASTYFKTSKTQCEEWLSTMIWQREKSGEVQMDPNQPESYADYGSFYLANKFHILIAPGPYTMGAAKGWHKISSGKLYYQTFIIPPIEELPKPIPVIHSIDANFKAENKVYEYGSLGFMDLTECEPADSLKSWILTVTGDNGYSKTYYSENESVKELDKGLSEGTYTLRLDAENDYGDTDYHTQNVTVIKETSISEKFSIAIIKSSSDNVDTDDTFTISSDESVPGTGEKIIIRKYYISSSKESLELNRETYYKPEHDNKVSFDEMYSSSKELYYMVYVEDTAGNSDYSDIIRVVVSDTANYSAKARLDTDSIFYEGIYGSVLNRSRFYKEKDGVTERFSAKDAEKSGVGDNHFEFYDYDNSQREKIKELDDPLDFELDEFKSYSGGKIKFDTVGYKYIELEAEPRKGTSDYDSEVINVLDVPVAEFTMYGDFKENRKLTLTNNSIFRPDYPLDDSKTRIVVTDLNNNSTITLRQGYKSTTGFLKSRYISFGVSSQAEHVKNDILEFMFTKEGSFKIEIYVEDTRGEYDRYSKVYTIKDDKAPINNFISADKFYRNSSGTATVIGYDKSESIDSDYITSQTIQYRKKGTPTWYNSTIADDGKIIINTTQLGIYEVKSYIKEDYFETLDEYNPPKLYSQKIYDIEIDNISPVSSFDMITFPKVNMLSLVNENEVNSVDDYINSAVSSLYSSNNDHIKVNSIINTYKESSGVLTKRADKLLPSGTEVEPIYITEDGIVVTKYNSTSTAGFDKLSGTKVYEISTTIEKLLEYNGTDYAVDIKNNYAYLYNPNNYGLLDTIISNETNIRVFHVDSNLIYLFSDSGVRVYDINTKNIVYSKSISIQSRNSSSLSYVGETTDKRYFMIGAGLYSENKSNHSFSLIKSFPSYLQMNPYRTSDLVNGIGAVEGNILYLFIDYAKDDEDGIWGRKYGYRINTTNNSTLQTKLIYEFIDTRYWAGFYQVGIVNNYIELVSSGDGDANHYRLNKSDLSIVDSTDYNGNEMLYATENMEYGSPIIMKTNTFGYDKSNISIFFAGKKYPAIMDKYFANGSSDLYLGVVLSERNVKVFNANSTDMNVVVTYNRSSSDIVIYDYINDTTYRIDAYARDYTDPILAIAKKGNGYVIVTSEGEVYYLESGTSTKVLTLDIQDDWCDRYAYFDNNFLALGYEGDFYTLEFSENFFNSIDKVKNIPVGESDLNVVTIIANQVISYTQSQIDSYVAEINKYNAKVLFLDKNGQNNYLGNQFASKTGGQYYTYSYNSQIDDKIMQYLRANTDSETQKGSTLYVDVNEKFKLVPSYYDYENDSKKAELWNINDGSFTGTSPTSFSSIGTYKAGLKQQDNTGNTSYDKWSGVAFKNIVVGSGTPPALVKLDIHIDIVGDLENHGIQNHRVDFRITLIPGTYAVNESSLNVTINSSDYFPKISENDHRNKKEFSKVFNNISNHSVTVSVNDSMGNNTTETFSFTIGTDLIPNPNFTLSGDNIRNSQGVTNITIQDNSSVGDFDSIGAKEYYIEDTKYINNGDGTFSENGVMYYPLELDSNNQFETSKIGTVRVKQYIEDYYVNGIGLNGEDLDQYRVYKSAEIVRTKTINNIAPTVNYKVDPKVLVKGHSINHTVDVMDDTNEGDIIEYAFYHNHTALENPPSSKYINSASSNDTTGFENAKTEEPTKRLDKKGLYDFYVKVTDENNATTSWVHGGQVKVVSDPIADFELYSEPTKNGGVNTEIKDNVFKTGSIITFKNNSFNEDYMETIANHGIEYTKIEYRSIGESNYTTLYESNNMTSYLYNYDLPQINNRNEFEVKLTIRSVDGIESSIIKQFTVMDLRLDAALEPGNIYASQSYKITAVASKDSTGAVAKDHLGNWITLDKIAEDIKNIYYEKEISTADTLEDNSYTIDVYAIYPFNNEAYKALGLTVNTPLNINKTFTPTYPDSLGAGDSIEIEAVTTSPVDVESAEAWLEGEEPISLTKGARIGNEITWTGTYNVLSTKPDKDYYDFFIKATLPNTKEVTAQDKVKVSTPIDLVPLMPEEVSTNSTVDIRATTTKYANSLTVTLFEGEAFETTLNLSGVVSGSNKNWSRSYDVPESIPEGNYNARFVARTPNGNIESDIVSFRVNTLKISGSMLPVDPMAGDELIFNITTEGYAEKLELILEDDVINNDERQEMGYNPVSYPVTIDLDETRNVVTTEFRYIVWCTTPQSITLKGDRLRAPYTFKVRAWKGSIFKDVEFATEIQGDIRQLIKFGITGND